MKEVAISDYTIATVVVKQLLEEHRTTFAAYQMKPRKIIRYESSNPSAFVSACSDLLHVTSQLKKSFSQSLRSFSTCTPSASREQHAAQAK